jgi:hypothetical protein
MEKPFTSDFVNVNVRPTQPPPKPEKPEPLTIANPYVCERCGMPKTHHRLKGFRCNRCD